ncbi:Fic family protein [Microbacterium nymphoidis]|uniref:Fic family protein n=1 Tax=Microbacterium nymphoidis TaxID=2898586 RepID=UPI001E2F4A30|nr:Fic family protein [Microbacterium nymphoidis]MCD2498052.1 Fic family protein [Microbacterium nymphoidis]
MSNDRNEWPAIRYETVDWHPAVPTSDSISGVPRRYRAAIPAPIAGLTPALDPAVVAAAENAGAELTRFDAELGHRVSAFAPVLLRSEAASSSQIENLTASARAIFSAELGARGSRNAELIAANTRAMTAAISLAENLSPDMVRELHRVLMAEQPRHTPGQWRTEAVWIGTHSDSPIGADFVAPVHERIPALIDDLVAFAGRRDVPALVSTAITHAQFETIHPFTDGNGRTGRALAQALLRNRGVTRNVAVPVSAGLLANVEGYHDALTAYRAGDPAAIVMSFAAAAGRAVANARLLVAEVDDIRKSWDSRLTARRSSNAWRLLDVIARQPVLNSAAAAEALDVKQPNVYPPLQALVDAGILKSKAEHKLGPFWRSEEVLTAIDRFAARAGRREKAR